MKLEALVHSSALQAEAKFKDIAVAYEVLSDPKQREKVGATSSEYGV